MGELYHYGVKGMKWGVRKDPYAKRRGQRVKAKPTREARTKPTSEERDNRINAAKSSAYVTRSVFRDASGIVRTAEKYSRKRKVNPEVKNLSDAELRSRINRLEMERRYTTLTEPDLASGYEVAVDILNTIGTVVGITGGVLTIYATVKNSNKTKDKE